MSDITECSVFKVGDQHLDAWGNEADPEENDSEDTGTNYNKLGAKELVAEVNKRNEQRADEDKIVFDGKPKKAEVVAALEADDKANADDEEE